MMNALLTRLEILVAVFVLLAGVKSAYNGTVRGLIENIREIPPMREQVNEMDEKQDQMIDGMVALSIAESDENTSVDTTQLAEDLRDGASYRVYLDREGAGGAYADVEDEREIIEEDPRWRGESDDG